MGTAPGSVRIQSQALDRMVLITHVHPSYSQGMAGSPFLHGATSSSEHGQWDSGQLVSPVALSPQWAGGLCRLTLQEPQAYSHVPRAPSLLPLLPRCSTSGMQVQQEIHIPRGTKDVEVGPCDLHWWIQQLSREAVVSICSLAELVEEEECYRRIWCSRSSIWTDFEVRNCIEVGEIIQSCLTPCLWAGGVLFLSEEWLNLFPVENFGLF